MPVRKKTYLGVVSQLEKERELTKGQLERIRSLEDELYQQKEALAFFDHTLASLWSHSSSISSDVLQTVHKLSISSSWAKERVNVLKFLDEEISHFKIKQNKLGNKELIEPKITSLTHQREGLVNEIKKQIRSSLDLINEKILKIKQNTELFKSVYGFVTSKRFNVIEIKGKELHIYNEETQHVLSEIDFLNKHLNIIKSSFENNLQQANLMIKDMPLIKRGVDIFSLPNALNNILKSDFGNLEKIENPYDLSKAIDKLILFENDVNQISKMLLAFDNVGQLREQIKQYRVVLVNAISEIKVNSTSPEQLDKIFDSYANDLSRIAKEIEKNVRKALVYVGGIINYIADSGVCTKREELKQYVKELDAIASKKVLTVEDYNKFYDIDNSLERWGYKISITEHKRPGIENLHNLILSIRIASLNASNIFDNVRKLNEKFFVVISENKKIKNKFAAITDNNWVRSSYILNRDSNTNWYVILYDAFIAIARDNKFSHWLKL